MNRCRVALILCGTALLLGAAADQARSQGSPSSSADAEARLAGRQVFIKWCATCHGTGINMPGTAALDAKYGGTLPAPLEERTDLSPPVVEYFVRNGVSIMPFFRKTEISDEELAALAAYLSATAERAETDQ